jgi:hypothetical protein
MNKVKVNALTKNVWSSAYSLGSLCVALIVLAFSLWIDSYYTDGDVAKYRSVYYELADLNIVQGYLFYVVNLDAREILHFILTWLASNLGIDRTIFNGFMSATLAYVAMKLFLRRQASFFVATFIVLFCVYFILLYTTTERLKLGMIFLFLSMLNFEKKNYFYFYAFLASISQIQIMIIYLAMFFYTFCRAVKNAFVYGVISKKLIISFFFIGVIIVISLEQILSKFNYYNNSRDLSDLSDLIKICFFLTLSLWYSGNKVQVIALFIPVFIAVLLLGGGRINLLGYFIFLYYALPKNNGLNFGVLTTTAYYSYFSIAFILGIIEFGSPPF